MAQAKRDSNFVTTLLAPSTVDGTTTLNVGAIPISNVNPLAVGIVDGSGTQITTFGGGTQYTDAGTPPANPVGPTLLWNEGGTWRAVSTLKPLPISGTLTVGGTTDNSAFTASTSTGTPAMGFFHSTIDAVTDGRAAALAIDAKRNLFTVLRDAAGNARGLNIDSNGALAATVTNATAANLNATVVGTGTFAVQATPVTQVDTFMLGGVNIKEINAVAPLMGNGASGTGALRVATTSDGTLGTVTTVSTVTNQSQEGGVNISLNAGAVDTGTRRVIQANGAGKTIVSVGGSASSSGNNTLVGAGTNKLKVFAFSLSTTSTSSTTCIFQSGASGTEIWRVVLQAATSTNTGANLAVSPPAWLFATASATLLNLNLSGANTVHWAVSYFDEA